MNMFSNLPEIKEWESEIAENKETAIEIRKKDIKNYERYLRRENLADSTIKAYSNAILDFYSKHKTLTKNNLLIYKASMLDKMSPRTINLRLQGINRYLEYIHKGNMKLKFVKVQTKPFLDNVISNGDYKILCRHLKKNNYITFYFLVRYMCCTGARVSEVIKFKREHVEKGWMDLYSKGGKIRRLYIPTRLANETLKWLETPETNIKEGYIFRNKNGIQITPRGINKQLKIYAKECKCIPLETVYPHSFRHRFSLNFLEKNSNVILLSDLLGHSSVETTRIYLRQSSAEQKALLDKIVTW